MLSGHRHYDIPLENSLSSDGMDRKVFVGGLNYEMMDDELERFFSQKFGPVETATVVKNRFNMSRGFGFIVFQSLSDCELAVSVSPFMCNGARVDVRKAQPKHRGVGEMSSAAPASAHVTHESVQRFEMA